MTAQSGEKKVRPRRITWMLTGALSILLFLLFVPEHGNCYAAGSNVKVRFNDIQLESAIRKSLGIPGGDISAADMSRLTRLSVYNASDLTGLEYAANLKELLLTNCDDLNDASILSSLTGLQDLTLGSNSVSNISFLSNLVSLKKLILHGSRISDISALENHPYLETLEIDGTQVNDISSLSNLNNLRSLELWQNKNIVNISLLKNLVNLTTLKLWANHIEDITPLTGLTRLQLLYLDENQIEDISGLANLTNSDQLSLRLNRVSDVSL